MSARVEYHDGAGKWALIVEGSRHVARSFFEEQEDAEEAMRRYNSGEEGCC